MKKLLALILTVIMVLSIMPMAYAKRAEYSPEIEEYIENYIRVYSYLGSHYETSDQKTEVQKIIGEAVDGKTQVFPSYENLINIEADERLDEIIALNESIEKAFDEIEKKIAADEIVIVTDIYEYYKYGLYIDGSCYYSSEDITEIRDRVENLKSEKYLKAWNEAEMGMETIRQAVNGMGGHAIPQAEFDSAMERVKPFYDLVFACLDGDHPYGEYISDNNATEEVDGTKTATCDFCGATDTITDEGTKLVKEEEPEETISFFEMIFALLKEFFAKIFSIFK